MMYGARAGRSRQSFMGLRIAGRTKPIPHLYSLARTLHELFSVRTSVLEDYKRSSYPRDQQNQ